ncbi:phospholipid scramblase 1-like [Haliotis cracherodii]|uniref:phospholipid scramblase 1-like n=1 Tax=Haliotis cracherodii TaxID=6455 RepID=UPI0039EBF297
MDRPILTQPSPSRYTDPRPPGTSRSPQEPDPPPRDIALLERQDELRIYQQLDLLDATFLKTSFERYNTYTICTGDDEACYFAKESSETKWRICLHQRPMRVEVKDNYGSVVMRLDRPWRCRASWLCCCHLQEMFIERPPGVVLATVNENWTCWRPEFDISVSGQGGFLLRGAWSSCRCASHNKFYVYDRSGEKVAVISKTYENCTARCAFLNDFKIEYLSSMSAQDKMLIFGAAFLVDFNYLELRV